MATPTPPYTLEEQTPYPDTLARINDNFRNVVQDLSAFGAKRTDSTTLTFTLGGNTNLGTGVNVQDPNNLYPGGIGEIAPRIEVFVDTDNDDTVSWPLGSALTAAQKNILPVVYVNRRAYAGATNVAGIVVYVANNTAAARTVYVHLDVDFLALAPTGNFR